MTINLRKNIARFIYIIDQTTNVESRAKILKELDLTENEFSELVGALLDFSNSNDKEWYCCNPEYHGFIKHLKSFQKRQIKNSYYRLIALNVMYNVNIPSQGYPPNGNR